MGNETLPDRNKYIKHSQQIFIRLQPQERASARSKRQASPRPKKQQKLHRNQRHLKHPLSSEENALARKLPAQTRLRSSALIPLKSKIKHNKRVQNDPNTSLTTQSAKEMSFRRGGQCHSGRIEKEVELSQLLVSETHAC